MRYRIQALVSQVRDSRVYSEATSEANDVYENLSGAIRAFCDYVIKGYSIDTECFDKVLGERGSDAQSQNVTIYGGIVLIRQGSSYSDFVFSHDRKLDLNTYELEESGTVEATINTEYRITEEEIEECDSFQDLIDPIVVERPWATFLPYYNESGQLEFEVWSEGFIQEGIELGFYQ